MDDSVSGIYRLSRKTQLSRPLVMFRVPAGFPSPAEDYIEGGIDLNRDLIRHPFYTSYIRVDGDSTEPVIHAGALLVVDRMAETQDDDIVVARRGRFVDQINARHGRDTVRLGVAEPAGRWKTKFLKRSPRYIACLKEVLSIL